MRFSVRELFAVTITILVACMAWFAVNTTASAAPEARPEGPPGLLMDAPPVPDGVELPDQAKAGRNRAVRVESSVLDQEIIEITLLDGITVTAERERTTNRGPGQRTWTGRIQGAPRGQVTIASRNGVVAGNIRHAGRLFDLRQLADGTYVIFESTESGFALPAEPIEAALEDFVADDDLPLVAAAAPGELQEIDLLVVYTQAAAAATGQASLEAQIDAAIEYGNAAYDRTGVMIDLNPVGIVQVDYVEPVSGREVLEALITEDNGPLEEARALREQYQADVVIIVVGRSNACGIAFLMSSAQVRFESRAYGVVNSPCLGSTLAHEIGHIQGLGHSRDQGSRGVFPYSMGYRKCDGGDDFATIMAYRCTGSTVAVGHFSDPDVNYGASPTGVDPDDDRDRSADATRSLNETAQIVASFRNSENLQPPSSATNLAATASGYDSIDLSWTDASSNEAGFVIWRAPGDGRYRPIGTVGANQATFRDTNLDASFTYQYAVVAWNSGGDASGSGIAIATTDPLPAGVVPTPTPTPTPTSAPRPEATPQSTATPQPTATPRPTVTPQPTARPTATPQQTPGPEVLYATANGESTQTGTVVGDYRRTHTDDGDDQDITEILSNGRRNQQFSLAEHAWTIAVPQADRMTLSANAYMDASRDGDSFVFAYSLDGNTFTNMFTVSSSSTSNSERFTLPSEAAAKTVTIRVRDTDREERNRTLDGLHVDQLPDAVAGWPWSAAICRRHGSQPYRSRKLRQRRTEHRLV